MVVACPNMTIPNLKVYNFGDQQSFYAIADSFVDSMQSTLSTEYSSYLFKYIFYNEGSMIPAGSNAADQTGFYVGVAVGILFILISFTYPALLIYGNIPYCQRRGNQAHKQKKMLSDRCNYATLVLVYIILFCFILSGTIVFSISVSQFDESLENTTQDGVDIIDTSKVTEDSIQQLHCNFQSDVESRFDFVSSLILRQSVMVASYWLVSSGASQLNLFDERDLQRAALAQVYLGTNIAKLLNVLSTLPELASSPICLLEIEQTKEEIDNINGFLQYFGEIEMPDVLFETDLTINQTNIINDALTIKLTPPNIALNSRIEEAKYRMQNVATSLQAAGNFSNQVAQLIDDFTLRMTKGMFYSHNYNIFKTLASVIVITPSVMVMLSTIVALTISVFLVYEPELKIPSSVERPVRVMTMVGAYMVMITAWMIMLLAISIFLIAYPLANTCYMLKTNYQTLFPKDEFLINVTNFFGDPVLQNYGTFRSLQFSRPTLYTGIADPNGTEIMNTDEILKFINTAAAQDWTSEIILSSNLSISFNQQTYQNFSDSCERISFLCGVLNTTIKTTGFLPTCGKIDPVSVNAVVLNIDRYINEMTVLQQKSQKLNIELTGVATNNVQFAKVRTVSLSSEDYTSFNEQLNSSIYNYIDKLKHFIYPMTTTSTLYFNSNELLCTLIRSPIDGMFASAGLISLAMMPLAVLLHKTSKKVHSNRNNKHADKKTDQRASTIGADNNAVEGEAQSGMTSLEDRGEAQRNSGNTQPIITPRNVPPCPNPILNNLPQQLHNNYVYFREDPNKEDENIVYNL